MRLPTFTPDQFIAAGGEATVHAVGDVAFKVFHQPVDAARLRALAALTVPGALLPKELLHDAAGQVVGHTMDFLDGAVPLSRLLSRRFCRDEGYDLSARLRIVRELADRVRAVHAVKALVVDLHDGNVLLADSHPVLIDTSSWQLPGHPATALQDSVRDRHASGFDHGTDWFAFAVTAAQLLLGVHPYRGVHPVHTTLVARMTARVSVFDPTVRLPPVCPPTDAVPTVWRDWLRSVLDGPTRQPPPTAAATPTWTPRPSLTSARLSCRDLARAPFPLADALEHGGTLVLSGPQGTWVDGVSLPASRAVTVTATGQVVAAHVDPDRTLRLHTLPDGGPLSVSLQADAIARLGHGFVVRSGPRLLQLDVRHGHALPRLLASVLPHATRLYDGLAVQDLGGACHLHLLDAGRCDTRRVPELDGWVVQHAQHIRGVVALVARREGRTDRFVLRTAPGRVELRRTADVPSADLDLAPLPTHPRAVALRVGSRLELFDSRPGADTPKVVEDPLLAHGRLVALEDALGLLVGPELLRISLVG